MLRISMHPLVSARQAPIFDLYGFVNKNNKQAVPCQIRVGRRRELEVYVNPDHFYMDFLCTEKSHACYLYHHPVPLQQDESGNYFFDAFQFLKDHGILPFFRSTKEYQNWKKDPYHSDTLLTTPLGSARALIDWSGDAFLYSYLYFMPGTLTINGQSIRSISWETCSEASGAGSEALYPLIAQLLDAPHDLTAQHIMRRVKKLGLTGMTCLWIQTEVGDCSLYNLYDYISSLDRDHVHEIFSLSGESTTSLVENGLKLMTCANPKSTLTRLYNQERIHRIEAEE